jgi:hypothetical protein
MTTATPNNLTFIPADALETNLSLALAGMGQSLKHQKLQEMAARVQGYPSLNHRTAPSLARTGLTFLLSDLYCDAGTDMVSLEVSYLVFSLTWEEFQKIKRAEAAAASIDPWARISFSAGFVDGYGEPDVEELDLDDPGSAADRLEALSRTTAPELYVRTEAHEVNITPALGCEMWVSGYEKHGSPYSSSRIELDKIEKAFLTGEFEGNDEWHLLPATEGEQA